MEDDNPPAATMYPEAVNMNAPVRPDTLRYERAAAADFAAVDTWVFDLDNTLYPPDSDLWPKIDARITAFLMHHAGLDGISARALQKHYYHKHGTTLNALMTEGHIDPDVFLSFVHDIDRTSIRPDLALDQAIARLPGRKLILTNGSVRHAEATAEALGILHHFSGISDIKSAGFVPKPERRTYETFFAHHGVEPRRAAMFEDLVKNLEAPHAFGMRTVLVVPRAGQTDLRDDFDRVEARPAFIEHVTDDLAAFLHRIA
jgi:putative hydrolase of the HAD superfamily